MARHLITAKDIGLCLGLPLFAACALALPQRRWAWFCTRTAPLARAMLARSPQEVAALQMQNDIVPPKALHTVPALSLTAHDMLRNMYILRRRHPQVTLKGEAFLRDALAKGKGAILWDSHFAHASLGTKVALKRAGYDLHHLTHPRHGISDSRFGHRILNPIYSRFEQRFLAQRVVMALASPTGALRQLGRILSQGGLVSITVQNRGAQPLHIPFLNTQIELASGAPDLALLHEAPLLPVFTVMDDEGVTCHIQAPLTRPDGPRKQARQAMAQDYARRLEPWVQDYPNQWFGWLSL